MEKIINKKQLLDNIRLSEGTSFQFDEEAILKEYQFQEENKSSLAIKILSIFGVLIATLALIGFLLISGLYDSDTGLLIFGVIFIVAAILLNKLFDKLIIDTFSLSAYVIGISLLSLGLMKVNVDDSSIIILIGSIAFLSLIITQNYIFSFISILIINGCFLLLIIEYSAYNLIHIYITINTLILAYLFLNEAKLITTNVKTAKLYEPSRIAIIVSLLVGLVAIGKKYLIPISQNYILLSSIVMFIVLIYLVFLIIKINKINTVKSKILIYSLSSFILLPTLYSPSIAGAIIIILLSFLVNYKTGLALGVISFIYFISQYYYDLNFTLLTKSIILFISGVMFLFFYFMTLNKQSANEKV